MAIVMSNDVSLVVNAVDLSDHVREITINMSADDLDATAMGALSKAHAVGLRDDRMEVTFLQDYASAKVDADLEPARWLIDAFHHRCQAYEWSSHGDEPELHDVLAALRLHTDRRNGWGNLHAEGDLPPGSGWEDHA